MAKGKSWPTRRRSASGKLQSDDMARDQQSCQQSVICSLNQDRGIEGPMEYIHINQNEFSYRKHKRQREEDIAVCYCKYDNSDPDSACGERCLNVLTNTECTPGYCLCGAYCKNQKFQRCEYAKTKLFNTDGRGWGLLADENIKAGRFIIEYCGEVISSKEAELRAQAYEAQGIKDAYMISLNAYESIDATRKGSLARFINHSCEPNCETRKWTVLGEIRVGIFAKDDITFGTELTYNYNFEWYGGAKVRCLCGAASCCGFLGAKSRGFQEDTYLWEDDDGRYSVEKIPLYDSAEDEPSSKLLVTTSSSKHEFVISGKDEYSVVMSSGMGSNQPLDPVQVNGVPMNAIKDESHKETNLPAENAERAFAPKIQMISHNQSESAPQNNHIGIASISRKKPKHRGKKNQKSSIQKEVDAKYVAQLLTDKEAQDEIFKYEQAKNEAAANLRRVYDEIRPAIEQHERDNQDNVPTSMAEKWIEAKCTMWKADFGLHFSIIKSIHLHLSKNGAGEVAGNDVTSSSTMMT
ncbi:hypothetical protein Ancab_038581 [Ancistrocladus abbreviatus]